jgi:hypothetical protein
MRRVIRIVLFAAEQSAVDALLGGSSEAARAVGRQRWFDLARLRLRAVNRRGNELAEFGQEGQGCIKLPRSTRHSGGLNDYSGLSLAPRISSTDA